MSSTPKPENEESQQAPKASGFYVISPDGFPITMEPFATMKDALDFIPRWCQQFETQGYYSTSNREKISLKDLPNRLGIVPDDLLL